MYYRYNIVQEMKTLHLSVFCPELVPETEQSQEPAIKSGKKGEEKSAGKAKDKGGKDKEKKPTVQKVKEEHVEVQQTGELLAYMYKECINYFYDRLIQLLMKYNGHRLYLNGTSPSLACKKLDFNVHVVRYSLYLFIIGTIGHHEYRGR